MSDDTATPAAGSTFDQQLARIAVGAYVDAQSVRTAMMNRIRDVIRKCNEGIPFEQADRKDEDGQSFALAGLWKSWGEGRGR